MSDTKRPHEAVRNALDIIRSTLAPLSPEHRAEVLAQLRFDVEFKISELMDQVAEWREHNQRRMAEVYEARSLLGAQPDETLPTAVRRSMAVGSSLWAAIIECVVGSPWFPDELPIAGQKRVKEAIEQRIIALRDRR